MSCTKSDLSIARHVYHSDLSIATAGYDAAAGDPLGGCSVTPKGYADMTRAIVTIDQKVVLVLEGGYNLESISKSFAACANVLIESSGGGAAHVHAGGGEVSGGAGTAAPAPLPASGYKQTVDEVRRMQSRYWKSLRAAVAREEKQTARSTNRPIDDGADGGDGPMFPKQAW